MASTILDRYPIFLFDIDGVLVDVRASYHETVIRTVILYLREVLGLPVPDDLLGRKHVPVLKRMGGFNNDWNSAAAMLHVLLAELPPVAPPKERTPTSVRKAARPLATLPDLEERLRRAARRIFALERTVRERGGGLATVRALLHDHNAHLVLYGSWDPATDPLVRIYQEIYMGPELFRDVFALPPQYYQGPGLINEDRRIISPQTLEHLREHHRLGLVTGRPRVEAEYTLKRLGLWNYFQVLVCHDDVVEEMARRGTRESLSKPHPWPLARAADLLDKEGRLGVAYIGDTMDDMRAAVALRRQRPSLAIGCTYVHADAKAAAEHLRAAGADIIVHHPDEVAPSDGHSPGNTTSGRHP